MLRRSCAFDQSAIFGSESISQSHTFGRSVIAESESWKLKSGSMGLSQQLPPTLKSKVIQRVNYHVVYHARWREFYHIELWFWCRFLRDMGDRLFCHIDRYIHQLHWPNDSVSIVSVRRHFEKSIRYWIIWFWQVDLYHVSECHWIGAVHADNGDVAWSGVDASNRPINGRLRCHHVLPSGEILIWVL